MASKKQGKSSLPPLVQDNIIQNIVQIFPTLSKDLIKGVLVKEDWDLEKSLRFLHATLQSYKARVQSDPKTKVINKLNSSNKVNKISSNTQKKPDLFKKPPKNKTTKPKADKEEQDSDWVVINKPSCSNKNPPTAKKEKQKKIPKANKPTKDDMLKTVQEQNMTKEVAKDRKNRRVQLIRSFDIIKHFGETSSRLGAYIKEGIKVMVLLRGCSGSGKSTYANQLLMKAGAPNPENHIFSTDNFFIGSDKKYNYNAELLQQAHEWNQKLVKLSAAEGRSPIFVDNTNCRLWEMKEYATIAVGYGYVLETLEPPTPWFFNEDILFRRTTHSTPRETIRKMLDRYEANLSGEDVLRSLNLSYKPPMIPPQGAMAGIDTPLSKKHTKMLAVPFEQSISPKAIIQSTKLSQSNAGIPKNINEKALATYNLNYQLERPPSPPTPAMSELSLNSETSSVEREFSSAESFSDSDSETGSSESNSFVEDNDLEDMSLYESDLEDPHSPFGNHFEYVLITENDLILFQKEHLDMKDIKTLSDFKNLVSKPRSFSKNFEDYLSKYIESAALKQSNDLPQESFVNGDTGQPAMGCGNGDFLGPSTSNNTENKNTLYPCLSNLLDHLGSPPDTPTNYCPKDVSTLQSANSGGNQPGVLHSHLQPKNVQAYNDLENDSLPVKDIHTVTSSTKQVHEKEKCNENNSIDTLNSLFPKVPRDKLLELFGTSLQDLDWAIGLLLDSGQEMVKKNEDNMNPKIFNALEKGQRIAPANPPTSFLRGTDKEITSMEKYLSLSKPSNQKQYSANENDNHCKIDLSNQMNYLVSSTESSVNPPRYIGDWDYKRESPKELPVRTPKEQRFSKPRSFHFPGIDETTNTNYLDFELLQKVNGGHDIKHMNLNIVVGNNVFIPGPARPAMVNSILMLEKGTMTSDIETNQVQKWDSGIERLALMFPRVARENLEELFEKCHKDIDWAAGLLLDSGQEISELFTSLEPIECAENEEENQQLDDSKDHSENLSTREKKTKRKKKIRVSKSENELHKDIQEKIQKNFVLDERHYSSERMRKHFLRKEKNMYNPDESEETRAEYQEDVLDDSSCNLSSAEEDIVFMMDRDLIFDLQSRFGGLLRRNMIGEKTVVRLPLNLARQLHSYIMDSIHEHIEEEDVITDEDEEYARCLQKEEMNLRNTPSLMEIMDEEVALRKTQKDFGNGRSIASTLSKQLLIERFPKMDPSTLAMILEDTNHSLHEATTLLSSAGHSQVEAGESENSQEIVETEKCLLTREEAIKQADAYGDVSSQLYEMRKDCLKKSQKAYREGNHSVSQYYSEMARWYMERIEKSNSMAAKAILSGHEGRTTLDLHFLQVGEALNVMDLFVDEVIRDLQKVNKKKEEVFIITGRGLHSSGGRPKLKPAVQCRLAKRDLRYCEQNPGMLKVIIPRTALTSYKQDIAV